MQGRKRGAVTTPRKGLLKMYETVKRVNGHAITRMKGTKGFYHVKIAKNKEMTFKTIKAAAEYCMTLPYKPFKLGKAFGMVRTKLGYITKEQLSFVISDDNARTKQTIDDFAKKYGCSIVEVWYNNDNDFDKFIYYKTFTYFPTLDSDTFKKLSIY